MKNLIFLGFFLFSSTVLAASTSCKQLKLELEAMHKAQRQIVSSLVNNHETFAATLEEYAVEVEAGQKSSGLVISQEMQKTAHSFRIRGVRGKNMARGLDKATEDLLARVAACLK